MLRRVSELKNYELQAIDGRFGMFSDMLFDDVTWKARWVVADTGGWVSGRQLLIHPAVVGQPDDERRILPVSLTRDKIRASPDLAEHEPVSMQMRSNLQGYYGFESMWTVPAGFNGDMSSPRGGSLFGEEPSAADYERSGRMENWDPHLRSAAAVNGYHIRAIDGEIGHVESFLVDDEGWDFLYLVIDTRNWWAGDHVLVAPATVTSIDFFSGVINLRVTRDQVKAGRAWQAEAALPKAERPGLYSGYNPRE